MCSVASLGSFKHRDEAVLTTEMAKTSPLKESMQNSHIKTWGHDDPAFYGCLGIDANFFPE